MLTLDKIYHAAFVLKDVARKTDLIEAPKLSKDCQLYLKTENLQATGSFKVRGAYYKISQLSEEESAKGVIACSAGNHALRGVYAEMTRTGFPAEGGEHIKDSIDCNLYFFGSKVSIGAMTGVMAGSVAVLIGIYILMNLLKKTD